MSQIRDRPESHLRSQLFGLGVMQLLLLKKERNAACPWSIYSTIPTQLSPRFWKYLRFPATCRFCCTSMSHCFCKAFMPVPPPCFKVASVFLHVDRFLPNDECMQVRSSTKNINKTKCIYRNIKNVIYKIWAKIIHKIQTQKESRRKCVITLHFSVGKEVEVWRLQLCFNLCTACFGVLAPNCGTSTSPSEKNMKNVLGECWWNRRAIGNDTQRENGWKQNCEGEGLIYNNGLMRTCSAWKCSWSSCFFASNSASVASKNTKNPCWHIL